MRYETIERQSSNDFIDRFKANPCSCWDEFEARYNWRIESVARCLAKNNLQLFEDITQAAKLKTLTNILSFRGTESQLAAWVGVVTLNEGLKLLKIESRYVPYDHTDNNCYWHERLNTDNAIFCSSLPQVDPADVLVNKDSLSHFTELFRDHVLCRLSAIEIKILQHIAMGVKAVAAADELGLPCSLYYLRKSRLLAKIVRIIDRKIDSPFEG